MRLARFNIHMAKAANTSEPSFLETIRVIELHLGLLSTPFVLWFRVRKSKLSRDCFLSFCLMLCCPVDSLVILLRPPGSLFFNYPSRSICRMYLSSFVSFLLDSVQQTAEGFLTDLSCIRAISLCPPKNTHWGNGGLLTWAVLIFPAAPQRWWKLHLLLSHLPLLSSIPGPPPVFKAPFASAATRVLSINKASFPLHG